MPAIRRKTSAEMDDSDRSALQKMLAYVEAECRRLGNHDAAYHAALAHARISAMPLPGEGAAEHGEAVLH